MGNQCRTTRSIGAARLFAAALIAAALLGSCSKARVQAASALRVVAITPSEAAAPGEFRGAEAFVRDFAAKGPGEAAVHAILPDRPKDGEAVASFIAKAAADPSIKAILVDPAVSGTAEGFRRVKEARAGGGAASTGLLCIAADSNEDPLLIESSADLVVDLDRVYRAYLVPWAAKRMGAASLVAVYAREEDADPTAIRERAIMSAASADLGLKYAAMTSPAGVDAAAFVRAGTGAWLRDYGPKAALYCSSPALVEPVIAGAIAGGGMVVDAAGEGTRAAYAAALGLDLSSAKGDPKKELRLLEAAVSSLGERGRFGLWDAACAEASVRGLGEFAMRVSADSARKDELKDLLAALDARARGAAWLADYDIDSDTGVRSANRILIRQDVYVLGKGYLQSALQVVPSKYPLMKTGGG
jgi:hypothetical protein